MVVNSVLITSSIIIVPTIKDYTGQWQLIGKTRFWKCILHLPSAETLDCGGRTIAYNKLTGQIVWPNGNVGMYDGKDTINWDNGRIWKHVGMEA